MKKIVVFVVLFLMKGIAFCQTLESESVTYNDLNVKSLELNFLFIDAEDAKKVVKARIQASDVVTSKVVVESIQTNGKTTLKLRSKRIYNLRVSAEKYADTTVALDLNQTVQENQIIKIAPKRVVYEIDINDMETDNALSFGIKLTNKNRDEIIEIDPKDGKNGKYKIKIREDDDYEVEIKNSKDYIFYSNTISGKDAGKVLKARMHTLVAGAEIRLYNITFPTAKYTLNENSRKELDRVLQLLHDHPTARIEIAAHTDNVGSVQGNLLLSQKRADAVLRYLVAKKIPAKRLLCKGYGASRPVATNDTEDGRAGNRRFELKVLSL